MPETPSRACARCHYRKVRCTGYPDCRNCSESQVVCKAYERARRGQASNNRELREAKERISWLQETLDIEFGMDCKHVATGTPLARRHSIAREVNENRGDCRVLPDLRWQSRRPVQPTNRAQAFAPVPHGDVAMASTSADMSGVNDDPKIGLLALNATGDLRYLGPSSGAFFNNYALALVRACASKRSDRKAQNRASGHNASNHARVRKPMSLSINETTLLLESYEMWIQPLYPLFDPEQLRQLVSRHGQSLSPAAQSMPTAPSESDVAGDKIAFYLVMALGAVNLASTTDQLGADSPSLAGIATGETKSTLFIPPDFLFEAALQHFELIATHPLPSISFIRLVLLFCIYSSHGPIGSSQWQLAGLAMRMAVELGLHYAPRPWQASAQDVHVRSRVFWTAYVVEITLAYNLGRPPSISEEHIGISLPTYSEYSALATHHIKHRQIQARIISQVYSAGRGGSDTMSAQERQEVISRLQQDLDSWRASESSANDEVFERSGSSYPSQYWDRLYHGTSFVLHRASPLCPRPSPASLEKCIRAAGAYLDAIAHILRNSNVPLSWMLAQGVLFAGLTMLVTARTNIHIIAANTGLPFLLIDLPAWTRKCSVSLAIINERMNERLISDLDLQFETLANDTMAIISTELIQSGGENANGPQQQQSPRTEADISSSIPGNVEDSAFSAGNFCFDMGMEFWDNLGWENTDAFREFLGMNEF